MKAIPANSVEVGFNEETFCFTFRFISPDGQQQDVVYVVISAAGAQTTHQLLEKQIEDYRKKHGEITAWPMPNEKPVVNGLTR